MRTSALAGGDNAYHPIMHQQEREHCRLDLDKVEAGALTPAEFLAKWRDALRALIITRL